MSASRRSVITRRQRRARLDAMVEITAGVPPEDLTEPDASRGLSFIVAAAQAHAETARAWAALHEVMFGGTG
jgi:hypothetical protein